MSQLDPLSNPNATSATYTGGVANNADATFEEALRRQSPRRRSRTTTQREPAGLNGADYLRNFRLTPDATQTALPDLTYTQYLDATDTLVAQTPMTNFAPYVDTNAVSDAFANVSQSLYNNSPPAVQSALDILRNTPPDVVVIGTVLRNVPGLGRVGLFVLQPTLPNAPGVPDLSRQPVLFFSVPGANLVGTFDTATNQIELGAGATTPLPANSLFFYNARGGGDLDNALTNNPDYVSTSINVGLLNSTVSDPLVKYGIGRARDALNALVRTVQGGALVGDFATFPSGEGVVGALVAEGGRQSILSALENNTTWFAGVGWRGLDAQFYDNGEIIVNVSGARIRTSEGLGEGGSGLRPDQIALDLTRTFINDRLPDFSQLRPTGFPGDLTDGTNFYNQADLVNEIIRGPNSSTRRTEFNALVGSGAVDIVALVQHLRDTAANPTETPVRRDLLNSNELTRRVALVLEQFDIGLTNLNGGADGVVSDVYYTADIPRVLQNWQEDLTGGEFRYQIDRLANLLVSLDLSGVDFGFRPLTDAVQTVLNRGYTINPLNQASPPPLSRDERTLLYRLLLTPQNTISDGALDRPEVLVAMLNGAYAPGTETPGAGNSYPPLTADQLAGALINLGSMLPGEAGTFSQDIGKVYSLYKLGDAIVDLQAGRGSETAFLSAAADVVRWIAPDTADEIAVAKKIYALVDAGITVASTPGYVASINQQISALEAAGFTAEQAASIVNQSAPGALNPGLLSAGNWLALASVGLSFVKEDWAKVASGITSIASTVALISAGAINPVIGVIGIFAAFLGTALGLSKPGSIPLGDDYDLTGSGAGNDTVRFVVGDKDFSYNIDSDFRRLDIDMADFSLHAVDVVRVPRSSDDTYGADEWRRADASDGGGETTTKYFLDAAFTFDGLFNGGTDAATGRLPRFATDENGVVTGFEITKEAYDGLKRALGASGTLDGNDTRMPLLADYVDDIQGTVRFRQRDNDLGMAFYTDINGDGTPDLVRQNVEIDKYRDGDGAATITLRDAVGRDIATFETASLASPDIAPAMQAALAKVTVGPMAPIGPTDYIGPGYEVALPAAFSREGKLTPEMVQAYAGLSQSDLLGALSAGDTPPAWVPGWMPNSFDGVERAGGGTLRGDSKADLLFGFDGDDRVSGGGGNDRLVGSGGDDILRGGNGQDLLAGNDGRDVLLGGRGYDVAYGGAGNDRLDGGTEDDTLFGGTGRDRIRGGAGNDLIAGGPGRDWLAGGSGNDIVSYADTSRGVIVDLARNRTGGAAAGDSISGFEGATGGAGNDTLRGSDPRVTQTDGDVTVVATGEDALVGGAGNDRLFGAGSNDELTGGAGRDLLDGGTGNDVVSYAASNAGVTVDLATGRASGGDAAGDRLVAIEGAFGSQYADKLAGSAAENRLLGGAGNDTLLGRAGNDLLQGGSGTDVLNGGTGNDIASFAELAPAAGGAGITVDLGKQTVGGVAAGDTLVSIEGIVATVGNDRLIGSSGINRLEGLAGNDTLDGRGGNDKLLGGDGADILRDTRGENDLLGSNGADRLVAGGGRDLLNGGNGSDRLNAGGGNDLLLGGQGADSLLGGAGSDRISGGTGNDRLSGGAGRDVLSGGAGADLIRVGNGDVARGGSGRDTAVVAGNAADYDVQKVAGGYRLIAKRGRTVISLQSVERIQFDNGMFRIGDDRLVRLAAGIGTRP